MYWPNVLFCLFISASSTTGAKAGYSEALSDQFVPVLTGLVHIARTTMAWHGRAYGITGRNTAQRGFYPARNPSTYWFKVPSVVGAIIIAGVAIQY